MFGKAFRYYKNSTFLALRYFKIRWENHKRILNKCTKNMQKMGPKPYPRRPRRIVPRVLAAKRPQDAPKTPQDTPKKAPRRPKMAPRRPPGRPKTGPRRDQNGPRRPKTPQDDPKTAQDGLRRPQDGLRRPQDASKTPKDLPRRLKYAQEYPRVAKNALKSRKIKKFHFEVYQRITGNGEVFKAGVGEGKTLPQMVETRTG